MSTLERRYDVAVCGAGCAGMAAALAAARSGAKTLLVERAGFAGGIITCVGLPYFDGLIASSLEKRAGARPGEAQDGGDDLASQLSRREWRPVITPGIPLELFAKMGNCAPGAKMILVTGPPHIDNVERFKALVDRLFTDEGDNLDVLYHAFASDVVMAGDRVERVRVAAKGGPLEIAADVVIDCTGDADIAFRSGAAYEESADRQPLTMHFRIGNVDASPDLSALCRQSLERAHARGRRGGGARREASGERPGTRRRGRTRGA